MINELFSRAGLSSNEMQVYLCLAEYGRASAHLISKRLKIPRTTVYSVLDQLVLKGVVSSTKSSSSTIFAANSLAQLLRAVELEKETLKQKAESITELIEQVKPYFKCASYSVPKLNFYDGRESVQSLLWEHLEEWRENSKRTDFTWWGYQDASFLDRYSKWIAHVWKTWKPEERVRIFTNETPSEVQVKNARPGREVKTVPGGFLFTSSIWVVGDYILLLMTRGEPNYAFEVKDPVFSSNLRVIFKLLWSLIPSCGLNQ